MYEGYYQRNKESVIWMCVNWIIIKTNIPIIKKRNTFNYYVQLLSKYNFANSKISGVGIYGWVYIYHGYKMPSSVAFIAYIAYISGRI